MSNDVKNHKLNDFDEFTRKLICLKHVFSLKKLQLTIASLLRTAPKTVFLKVTTKNQNEIIKCIDFQQCFFSAPRGAE